MSEVLTQRRPMAGLDETIGRLGPSFFDERKDGYLLAELLRIIADYVEPQGEAEPKGQEEPHGQEEPQTDSAALSKRVPPEATTDAGKPARHEEPATSGDCAKPRLSDAEEKRAAALVPLISGDFAAIEAGLLGGLRDEDAVSHTGKADISPCLEPASKRRSIADNRPDAERDGAARRSRLLRPRYAMAGFLLIALAGAGVNFGLDSPHSTPTDIAALEGGNAAEIPQLATSSDTSAPVLDGGNLRQASVEPEAPAALAAAQRDDASAAAPDAVELAAPKVPEPASAAGPAEPDVIPPQPESPPLAQAKTEEAPPPAQLPDTAVSAPGTKPAAQAKPPVAHKTRHPANQGRTRHVAKSAKASPARPRAAEPAPGAEMRAEAPAPQTPTEIRPVANDPLALVQGALNSFAGAAAKLFEPGQR
jgi:hypothetical protein